MIQKISFLPYWVSIFFHEIRKKDMPSYLRNIQICMQQFLNPLQAVQQRTPRNIRIENRFGNFPFIF